jgi:GDPmannose 4,6-dehydratase
MLQQEAPADYVIATGHQHSVRAFVELAAAKLGFEVEWRGKDLDEQGIDVATGRTLVRIDSRYFRPTEVDTLLGDATKARTELGWVPEVDFEALVTEMVEADLALAERDALVAREGYAVLRQQE